MAEHLNTLSDEIVQKGKGSGVRFFGGFVAVVGIGAAAFAAINGAVQIAVIFRLFKIK